ncbi:MAG: GNAT family N-acetyltransferase [Anaerolineales bacterium]|nr:MAG: GNAT family N-acetyltransferase [Anaerolineales bacterium]
MDICAYQGSDQYALYAYWRALGENIPYFFPVSPERWGVCLLEDRLDGEFIFDLLETYVAKDKGQVVGFAQVGHPRFSWDAGGQKYDNPRIGNIRHFYFETGRHDVAKALYARAESFLKHFPHRHAFYHIYGMSCNAHHGKLHLSLEHVDAFLRGQDFQIEHENVTYRLALDDAAQPQCDALRLIPQPRDFYGPHEYVIWLDDTPVGTLKVRYMDLMNGEAAKDAVYLTLMAIDQDYRRRGWGSQALKVLCRMLRGKGYAHLFLDTAHTNTGAQRFYERFGFSHQGCSRSYILK